MLCLAARVDGLDLAGVELQPGYADLARRNLADNGKAGEVVTADIRALPADLRARNFDHVICNPPYFLDAERSRASAADRELALAGEAELADWVDVAARRLRPGGQATFIQRAERLPDLLGALSRRLGSVAVWPVQPRRHRAARLVLVRARKGGRAGFRLLAPLVLHAGCRHEGDGDSYRPEVSAVLRDAAPLPFPD